MKHFGCVIVGMTFPGIDTICKEEVLSFREIQLLNCVVFLELRSNPPLEEKIKTTSRLYTCIFGADWNVRY
jgi:hypothetical protein